MIKVHDARFIASATALESWPKGYLPEVAFVGRSNVGKSSMINTLLGRRKLVRVSNTPGRTRTLNFFEVELERDKKPLLLRLCDLPGYGFAKASKTERSTWQDMIAGYLEKRNDLKVVVAIVDGEIGATPDDVQTLDWLQSLKARILVVATKLDRLNKARRKPQLAALQARLELPEGSVLGFSSTEPFGVDAVWSALVTAAG